MDRKVEEEILYGVVDMKTGVNMEQNHGGGPFWKTRETVVRHAARRNERYNPDRYEAVAYKVHRMDNV